MKDILTKPSQSIKSALKQITRASSKCLIVVDDDKTLIGTLSDGDLRKAILSGTDLSEKIDKHYNPKPTFFLQNDYDIDQIKKIFINNKFDIIPIVDTKSIVIEVLTWDKIFKDKKNKIQNTLSVPTIIMAGGKGTRLQPFTKVLPKPLIPIHEKPIIEHIIERFTDIGCSDFYLTVNYKGKILKAFFEELQPEYEVEFVDEKDPLGTAGSLQYLKGQFNKPFFVTNCDVIIKADYASLYEFHQKNSFDITLVASAKEYIIPYGTCELNGDGHLSHINEKPKYDFLINTGLYILNPGILNLIPENKLYHITHLIEDAKNQGKKVGVFPIDEDAWIDIGQWAEYKKALDIL
jgi:dTDP-glucose pyrophosphorylase